ncbi:unnamed protein product [Dicrocoelium dendriticum]|nr:unnamed protein product [Dicrocoelium dendriticum]
MTQHQIWPPPSMECAHDVQANSDFWDDSDLVAHYDRVDTFVKQKLHCLTAKDCTNGLLSRSTPPRQFPEPPRAPTHLQFDQPTAEFHSVSRKSTPAHVKTPISFVNHPSDSLEAALQSHRPPSTIACDFEWLPPLICPPDLFSCICAPE